MSKRNKKRLNRTGAKLFNNKVSTPLFNTLNQNDGHKSGTWRREVEVETEVETEIETEVEKNTAPSASNFFVGDENLLPDAEANQPLDGEKDENFSARRFNCKPETENCKPGPAGRGIVLIALGAPQYGRMAANLASSIRFADAGVKIHLVWCGRAISHLSAQHKALFTSMAECPPQHYTKHGKTVYIRAKTCVYDLSPFDETIFLDSDMILVSDRSFKNATTIFDSLSDVDFTFQNRDHFDLNQREINERYSLWCNIREVKEKYFAGGIEPGKGKYYSIHSEFIYFKRTEKNKAFFDLARQIFDNPKVKGAEWGGDLPDEMAFAIAMALTGHYPHCQPYLPIHWFAADKKKRSLAELTKDFFGMSIGGNVLPNVVKNNYEHLAKTYARLLGLPYFFKVHSKKSWAPERMKM